MAMKIHGMVVNDGDLNQRFAHTYIEVVTKRIPKPFLICPVVFDVGIIRLPDGDNIGQKDCTIIREFPELGAIQYQRSVHFLSRLPVRQWQRGLTHSVITDFVRGTDKRFTNGMSMEQASCVFYPTYLKLDDGIEALKKEELVSFAYNRKFWFSGNKKKTYLWYEDIPVGEIFGKKIVFNEQCISLRQEVIDEFRGVLRPLEELF